VWKITISRATMQYRAQSLRRLEYMLLETCRALRSRDYTRGSERLIATSLSGTLIARLSREIVALRKVSAIKNTLSARVAGSVEPCGYAVFSGV